MAHYPTSTQRRLWTFTAEQLVEQRLAVNEAGRESTLAAALSSSAPSSSSSTELAAAVLAPAEEAALRAYYRRKIQEVCRAFAFPHKLQATAVAYFERFYLKHSAMDYHPKHIMLTCVYVACKAEEFHVSAEEFGKGIDQNPAVVLKNELPLLQALDFDLVVISAYRPLEGFLEDFKQFSELCGETVHPDKLRDVFSYARSFIDSAVLSDVPLIFPPGQIAMSALALSLRKFGFDPDRYIRHVLERSGSSEQDRMESARSELFNAIRAIQTMTAEAARARDAAAEEEEVRRIDRKLRLLLRLTAGANKGTEDDNTKQRREKDRSKKTRASGEPVVDGSENGGAKEGGKRRKSSTELMAG